VGLVAHMGEMHAGFWLENLKENDYLADRRTVLRSVGNGKVG